MGEAGCAWGSRDLLAYEPSPLKASLCHLLLGRASCAKQLLVTCLYRWHSLTFFHMHPLLTLIMCLPQWEDPDRPNVQPEDMEEGAPEEEQGPGQENIPGAANGAGDAQ